MQFYLIMHISKHKYKEFDLMDSFYTIWELIPAFISVRCNFQYNIFYLTLLLLNFNHKLYKYNLSYEDLNLI